jgi:hypothetical protein
VEVSGELGSAIDFQVRVVEILPFLRSGRRSGGSAVVYVSTALHVRGTLLLEGKAT